MGKYYYGEHNLPKYRGGGVGGRPLAPPVLTALKFVPAMLRKSSTPLQLGTLYCAQKGKRQRTHPWRDAANSNDFLLVFLPAGIHNKK